MTTMYQCELVEVNGNGRTTGWIDERGAMVGAHVELGGRGGPLYLVADVYQPGMNSKVLADKQAMDRRSLPSIAAAA